LGFGSWDLGFGILIGNAGDSNPHGIATASAEAGRLAVLT